MWLSQVILSLMKQGSKCLIASMEMKPVVTLGRMINMTLGSPEPTPEYVSAWVNKAKDKLWIYDQLGVTTSQDMFSNFFTLSIF
jgi:hypothetical protein